MADVMKMLKKDAKYALNSRSRTLIYEVYGEAKMARRLGAITKAEFFELNEMLITNGINDPKLFSEQAEITEIFENKIKDFTKALIDAIGNGSVCHSSDIADFAVECMENMTS